MAFPHIDVLKRSFVNRFESSENLRIFRAPGRVNLIGEHTDYNLGFVLPIAMEMACYAVAAPSGDNVTRFYSRDLDDLVEWPVDSTSEQRPRGHWSDYPIGVAQQLIASGNPLRPLNVLIHSTVPVGSGLSSSAALEVSSALALLFGREIPKGDLAKLAQRAEREFVGVPVGIMDQYVSVFGEQGQAIQIDCRSLTHESVPLPSDVMIVAVNSMVKHDLGSSEYPARVRECGEAVEILRKRYSGVQSLRDASSEMVETSRNDMPDVVYRRARHVTTEDERVLQFKAAAASSDVHTMGRLFLASHRSLQSDYEVSAEELDFLVDTASAFSGVYGARMTGGGFGGCTVNLISPDRVEAFRTHITAAYQHQFQITPQIYNCIPSEGASEIFAQ